jgi:tetratricopeptide (TPR) repeat protein
MPSHIYIRVGRYHDASLANERAIASDQAYTTQCHAQGIYPLAYMPHNHHFLWASATLEGRSARALEAARVMAGNIDQATMREPGLGTLQHYWITPLYALTRFGKWDEILATPRPDDDLVYPIGVWHYARGTAYLRTGKLAEARSALDELTRITDDPALEAVTIWDMNFTADLLRIAEDILAGELAAAEGDYGTAVARLESAVKGENDLNYDEPPPWHFPVRQALGAVLLEAGRSADAERVYREDLERFPENGWSLFGLHKSLTAQGKEGEAETVRQRFGQAWQYADVTLKTSRI